MNVFQKVTLQSLRKNKTRTIVTIIGILLSAAMLCAVTTFASSIYNYILENAIYNYGDWHGCADQVDYDTRAFIEKNQSVSQSMYAQQLGYATLIGCQNEHKPYLYVLGVSQGFDETMPVHITSGRYPASAREILIPEHVYDNGGVELTIGDTLTLGVGNRMLDGFVMGQHNPFYTYDESGDAIPTTETLEVKETRTYTVVGFYEP